MSNGAIGNYNIRRQAAAELPLRLVPPLGPAKVL